MRMQDFRKQRFWGLLFGALVLSLGFNFYFLIREFWGFWGLREEGRLKVKVVRVVDGDTFDIEGERRVRLAGIDAPEYPEGCLASEAKDRLEELVLGKETEIEEVGKDNFGRSLAFVFVDKELVNRVLVEEGLAKVGKGDFKYSALLLGREEEAKQALRLL